MNAIVGYLTNTPGGLQGAPGLGYDYILAGNGVWVRAERRARDGTPILRARVLVGEALVRGLAPMEQEIELPQGKVPVRLLKQVLGAMALQPGLELQVAICWAGGEYGIVTPVQERHRSSVRYEPAEDVVVDLHSHGTMGAFFSGTDTSDDQGFRISAVVGRLDQPTPQIALRVGLYGYFAKVRLHEAFGLTNSRTV